MSQIDDNDLRSSNYGLVRSQELEQYVWSMCPDEVLGSGGMSDSESTEETEKIGPEVDCNKCEYLEGLLESIRKVCKTKHSATWKLLQIKKLL